MAHTWVEKNVEGDVLVVSKLLDIVYKCLAQSILVLDLIVLAGLLYLFFVHKLFFFWTLSVIRCKDVADAQDKRLTVDLIETLELANWLENLLLTIKEV